MSNQHKDYFGPEAKREHLEKSMTSLVEAFVCRDFTSKDVAEAMNSVLESKISTGSTATNIQVFARIFDQAGEELSRIAARLQAGETGVIR